MITDDSEQDCEKVSVIMKFRSGSGSGSGGWGDGA